jgi:hypothetical protein
MIASIQSLDRVTAVGILARAALAVENPTNPAAALIVPNEQAIREDVIAETRRRYGIAETDDTEVAREKLGDALDSESDALLGDIDSARALKRLAVNGELPSDLYKVTIIPNIEDFHGRRFAREKGVIEETVRSPDLEQHYGPPKNPHDPYLLSVFTKTFPDKYPARSFIMLVAAERHDLTLTVHQAWRLYPDEVDLAGASDPVDMLQKFAAVFGYDVTAGNQQGRFIFLADVPTGTDVLVQGKIPAARPGKTRQITVSYFHQVRPTLGVKQAALIVAIDLDKYRAALKSHGYSVGS